MNGLDPYGRFWEGEHCFELTSEPPRKWVNLHYNRIGEHEIYSEITNIGDGTTWVRDGDGRRCTLVGYDNKYIYIRDDEDNTVFCPWGQPAPKEVADKRCRYYAAKTEVESTCADLRVRHRVFVPREYVLEAWTLEVENLSDRPRQISVFAYAMFQLDGCDAEGRCVGKNNYAEVHPEIGGVLVTNRNTQVPTNRYKGYLVTLNDGFAGGTGYRDSFTRSDFGYGTPKILWGWNADNRPGFGPDCCGLVQVTLTIPPKSTARADFLLGQTTGLDDVARIRGEVTPDGLDAMCDEQMRIAIEQSRQFTVRTGDADYDGLINTFVKKQLYSYLINKSGFRDNLQVDNAIALFDYPAARDNLLRALASQYDTGSVPHGFRPLNALQYADKPAWILLTVPGLIAESGETELLDEIVPYFRSEERGTVLDHMLRAMRFLATDLGANGLCNQHHADWNDGLEATAEAGERESVMVTQQLCYGLKQLSRLATCVGKDDIAVECEQRHAEFAARLNDVAWDGKWYVRTICGDGYRIGSSDAKEGKIFLNPQSWAILGEIATPERAAQCMASVDELLAEPVGFRICAPPFSEYDPRVGRMSNSMPGHVENGGCYCHAAGFKGVADCLLGRDEQAWQTFVRVAPGNPENPITQSENEPFSFTNFYSTVPFAYGRGGYPWRTGTAGWFTVLLVEWILGARRSYDGLLIDPHMPASMTTASVTRTFRGTRYEISLDNTTGKGAGVSRVVLDGTAIEGTTLPAPDGETHTVEVTIG
jgi:cellobiose phosphorylase